MTPEESRRGIEAYGVQQTVVKGVIASHGGELHQDDFDSEFRGRRHPFPITPLRGGTFILGTILGGAWVKWLDLTQNMVHAGFLKTKGKVPNKRYCLPKEEVRCSSK